ncbi:MAG: alpha-D-ribose 1-methylphosphonate 5-triphosphate diphosphatase [Actinobacteria bacterium]|nr:alpha-D-ribose 1-methylphosphonate 5-triphosphate diphosphatase [Acidimicrobiia bacterium]NDB41951.1 alpha-D-ribose 1-methylphosphonate 5-triphosphate diphosphatase [Actinomycetota bacterium]
MRDSIFSITNVTAVLNDSLLEHATITIERGVIIDVAQFGPAAPDSINGSGSICIPGVVDSHSDGFEQELNPRPNATLPSGFALRSFESRVRAAGITTMFHGIGFENDEKWGRTVDSANELCDAIVEYAQGMTALIDHRILYRLDARDSHGYIALIARLNQNKNEMTAQVPLISFEDHTPGQGQYTDRTVMERYIASNRKVSIEEAQRIVDQTIAERDALIGNRDKALPWLTEHAASGAINLMAHDPATSKDIAEAVKWSASIAEFPTTIESAKLAKESGLRTVCGAPNVLRGKSHSGNVSAQELISKGLCDGLASDYLPTSLLGSAAALVERKVCSLPQAIRLITSGPAKTVGLNDRGEIAVGKRADLALIRLQGNLPTVFGVLTANSQHAERLSLVGASA